MAIEFSTDFAANVVTRMTARNTGSSSPGYDIAKNSLRHAGSTGSAATGPQSLLIIMKGTIPSNFSTLTNLHPTSSRLGTDALVIFMESSTFGNIRTDWTPTVFTTPNLLTVNTNYVNASASGTATWFYWVVAMTYFNPYNISQHLFGNIGLVGSGADLEIPDVSIVSGNPYRVLNLSIRIPYTWA